MSDTVVFFFKQAIGKDKSFDAIMNGSTDKRVIQHILEAPWIRMSIHYDKGMKDITDNFCLPVELPRTKEAVENYGVEKMREDYDTSFHPYIHIYVWAVDEYSDPDGSYDS